MSADAHDPSRSAPQDSPRNVIEGLFALQQFLLAGSALLVEKARPVVEEFGRWQASPEGQQVLTTIAEIQAGTQVVATQMVEKIRPVCEGLVRLLDSPEVQEVLHRTEGARGEPQRAPSPADGTTKPDLSKFARWYESPEAQQILRNIKQMDAERKEAEAAGDYWDPILGRRKRK